MFFLTNVSRYRQQLELELALVDPDVPNRSESHSKASKVLGAFKYNDWQVAYRIFEFLQDLPYAKAAQCDCGMVIGDGTLQTCIKVQHLHVLPPEREPNARSKVSFQQHTLLKNIAVRKTLTR